MSIIVCLAGLAAVAFALKSLEASTGTPSDPRTSTSSHRALAIGRGG
jgi:hypothetical protein